ncbi:DUF6174 domain-containing protein [Alteromonas sp. BMJM2]|uniref:DUF6174 domain-containing protein n=1 Tax=Alteromonas sp. BMJM2 TaxID=2954241 RepID=UPI0022B302BF|nr:DUF6174 domain-containing protein [Alteromonas sp. BMJM2]
MDSRNPITIVTIGIVTLFLLGAWVISHSNENFTIRLAELSASKARWEKLKPIEYNYTVKSGCMFVQSYNIEHRNRQIFKFPVGQSTPRESLSIKEVFDIAEKATRLSYSVDIIYHPYFGYPELIDVDWDKDIIDDECFVQITDFDVLTKNEI